MSADGGSPLDGLWDSISSAVVSFVDAFGWILPALVLTILFLGLIALVAFWLDDLPFDFEILQGVGGIFRWTRRWWRGESVR